MLKFFRNNKGYISIFLCLVLLPMVTYSTMIIDAARLQSARVQVQSAGDLAMNAAMSEYEQVLEDMYGLFANATSMEQIQPAVQTYFEETISGKLKTVDSSDAYVQQLAQFLTNTVMNGDDMDASNLTNFLQMELATDESDSSKKLFSIQAVPNSAISNPQIMKGQIIDYMKYKGPVSVGQNFLNKLGFLKDTKAQSNAVQSKIDLAEQVAGINEYNEMTNAYTSINTYNDETANYNTRTTTLYDELQTMKDELDKMAQILLLRNNMVKLYEAKITEIPEAGFDYATLNIDEYWNGFITDDQRNNFSQKADDLANTASKLQNICSAFTGIMNINTLDQVGASQAQWYTFTYTITEEGSSTNRIDNIKLNITLGTGDHYQEILDYWNNYNPTVPDENNLADWQAFYDKQIEGINGNPVTGLDSPLMTAANRMRDYKGYLTAFNNLYGYFCQQYQNYKDIFEDTYSEANPDTWEDMLNANEDYVTYTKVKMMLDKVKSYILSNSCVSTYNSFGETITSEAKYMTKAGNISKNVADKFNKFHTSTKILHKALDNAINYITTVYGRAVGVQNTANRIKAQQVEQIEDDSTKSQMNSDIDALAKSVDHEEVDALKKVLEIYRERFKSVLDNLETVKYLGTTLYDYHDLYGYCTVFKNKEQLSGTAEGNPGNDLCTAFIVNNPNRHEGYDNITEGDALKAEISKKAEIIDGKKHTIDGTEYDEVFYNVMRNTEDAKNNKPKEESGGQLETTLNEAKDNSKVNANGTNDKDVSGNVDSQSATEAPKPEGDYEGGKESEFQEAAKEISVTASTGYGKVSSDGVAVPSGEDDNPKDKASKGKEQLAQANGLLESIANLGNNLKNDVYLEEYFTEMFTCQTDKKIAESELILLNGYSNNPKAMKYINPKNAWYGNEIEYILWGENSLGENLKKTETTIFLLRFAINAIYAFTASDIQAMANSIATLLVGWTVVLVPVVQVCIILALALAESALDLQMLKDGRDVPLIKDGSTFICSPQGAINKGVEYGVQTVTKYAVDKVDEGIDKLGEIGKEKTSELKAQANKIATEFIEQQTQSMASAIADNFTGPLVQSITPALSKLTETKDNADIVLRATLKETWESIGNNIPTGKDPLSVGGLTRELYEMINIDEQIDDILSKVDFSNLTAGKIESVINEKIIGTKDSDGKFQFSDGSWLGKIKGSLDTAVKNAADGLETKLNEGIDQGVDNLKEYANEKIEEAGNKLAEKSSRIVSDYVTIGTKSTSVAAKVTMNYKEYCKLFIFIGLLGNQEDAMMQRAAALMQVNVKYAVKGTPDGTPKKAGTENFHMTQAYTLFIVEADMKLGTLFPWAVKVETDDTGMDASPDFSHLGGNYVNMKYSGLAGY